MTNSRKARIRRQRQRRALLTMALVLVTAFACIGGTIAWLTATSGEVTNTFTVGNIAIDLKEHDYVPDGNTLNTTAAPVTSNDDYKMVPGRVLPKDPYVTVTGGSEACWLFVKVEESAGVDTYLNYSVNTAEGEWTALDGEEGVYYREVSANAADQTFDILTGNTVTVKDTVTKTMMDAITAGTADKPTLTFTAYAVQSENLTVEDAWAEVNP